MKKSNNSISHFALFLTFLVAGSIFDRFRRRLPGIGRLPVRYARAGFRNANGECLRTSKWSPTVAIKECDPGIVADRSDMVPVREEKAMVSGVPPRLTCW